MRRTRFSKQVFQRLLAGAAAATLVAGCSTSPTGRKQLTLLPEAQMNAMGVEAFQQLKSENKTLQDPATVKYVKCVVEPLLKTLPKDQQSGWEIQVFQDDTANAFALPGKKIGVHVGILPVAGSDAQLAAVVGHEIGHVLAEHGNERASQTLGTQLALAGAAALSKDSPQRNVILGALGVGAQVGVLLPFSRTQESEADIIGEDMMAEAGFDPRASVDLWKNMMASGGGAPPEFLSTHPSGETRIERLKANMPTALQKYQRAQADGRNPECELPSKYSKKKA